ncbi:translation initiation factor IF-2-like isoform X2 [Paramacrobiotus metropolitanus]|uniref:translation initiation factor IF-2-like isoform X2 n=1 Tax=Paramacrobiotus metropolitanus TaxID=2943436 RepID=UPI0024463B59|nr:translation initiation factor IF-2-like isoform X2 [Paramacrobiotus metropolitanus]
MCQYFSSGLFYLSLLAYSQCISAILTGQQAVAQRPNFRYINRQFQGSSAPTYDTFDNNYDPDQDFDYGTGNQQEGYDSTYSLHPEANAQSNYDSTDDSAERSPVGGTGGRQDPVRPFDPARTPTNSQLDVNDPGVLYWTSRDSPASVSGQIYSSGNRNPAPPRYPGGPGMSDVQQPNRRPLLPWPQPRPSQNTSRPQPPNRPVRPPMNTNTGYPMERPDILQDTGRPSYNQPNRPRPSFTSNSNRPSYQNTGNQIPICRTEPGSNSQPVRPPMSGRPGRRPGTGDILADPGRGNVFIQGLGQGGQDETDGYYQGPEGYNNPYTNIESQQRPSWPVDYGRDGEQTETQTIAGIKAAAGWLLFRIIPDAVRRLGH